MKLKDLGFALIGVIESARNSADNRATKLADREREIEIELKKRVLADPKQCIAEDRAKFDAAQHNFKVRGEALRQIAEKKELAAERCNHRKGGQGLKGIVEGLGDSTQYSVIKHRHRNGDTHIHCLRCLKIWMPGDTEYYKALNFQTLNIPSTDMLVATKLDNGRITGDFAEAFRKWTNARPYKGIAFSPTQGIDEATKMALELQNFYKDERSAVPVTFRQEYVPTLVKTEVPAEQNAKFNFVQNVEPNVS